MRALLLPIGALVALLAYQRPDWVAGVESGLAAVNERLAGLGNAFAQRPGTIAARADEAAPDRAEALAAVERAAAARRDLFAAAQDAPPAAGRRDASPEAEAPAKGAARARVEALLREAAATLAGSEALGELRAMQAARLQRTALREQLARQRLAGDAQAADTESRLAAAEAELSGRADAFTQRLGGIGVNVSREAAENLAVSVNGDEVVALLGAYGNIERLEGELREAVAEAQDNEALVRRYYALHATLLAVLETVQEETLSRIDTVYRPRLEAIDRDTAALRGEAQTLLRDAREAPLRAALEANLRAHELTLRATGLYRRYLQDQRNGLATALERTRAARQVADNTARTATLALDVAGMMRNGGRDVGAVLTARPPVLVPFGGTVLRREFEGLSRRMGEAGS
ncbi:hypothetical protein M0638_01695 [Roseomonas sp. NAR14]|uniref:Uncharacterized protein n=1 Tax=Roseomonas acroporae TaxID=2937791 RepID=A0A9X1Y464_9PROT|nr:hypothetical protein [Roseomonas acroporae]MCK8783093.1 hypothetical protein [Roseomonas acroporae]